MKKSFLIVSFLILLSCNNQEEYHSEKLFDNSKLKDSVTIDILQFIIPTSEFSQGSRNSDTLRKDIQDRLSFFSLIYYFPKPDSSYYFLISKKIASVKNEVVGIGGHYKIKNKNIVEFVEEFQTPKMSEEDLRKKGVVVFKEMMKEGNITKFVTNKSLVEFPDNHTYYDTHTNSWKTKAN